MRCHKWGVKHTGNWRHLNLTLGIKRFIPVWIWSFNMFHISSVAICYIVECSEVTIQQIFIETIYNIVTFCIVKYFFVGWYWCGVLIADVKFNQVVVWWNALIFKRMNSSLPNPILINGDFNMPDIIWSTLTGCSLISNNFCEFIFQSNLVQVANMPTHKHVNTLDTILTDNTVNIVNLIDGGQIINKFSVVFICGIWGCIYHATGNM